jgi:hypothetical protein
MFKINGIKIDFCFNYIFGERFATATHLCKRYQLYYQKKYYICSADLLGIRVHVPCDPKVVIINEYRMDWKKPIEKWGYYDSPFNKGEVIWSKNKKYKAFREFD